MSTGIDVDELREGDEEAWARFVRDSNDGTLHHELPFLAYHAPDRFGFRHLIVRRGAEILAVVPGGIVDRDGSLAFVSPVGASVGGPLFARPVLSDTLEVVEALQAYALANGWSAVEFVLGPHSYQRVPADTTAFALFTRGFRLRERELTFVVPLQADSVGHERLFRKKQAWAVRAARRRGVDVLHGGIELLEPFATLFRETYERHGVSATHSEAEIADLLRRLPDRVEIALAARDGLALAGVLIFRLNERAAQTFYICSSSEHAREGGTVTALAAAMDRLAAEGFRALDLGPSASSRGVNEGVVFFKEGLGAVGQARDRWTWDAAAPQGCATRLA